MVAVRVVVAVESFLKMQVTAIASPLNSKLDNELERAEMGWSGHMLNTQPERVTVRCWSIKYGAVRSRDDGEGASKAVPLQPTHAA